jgi:2-polyprenyl-3-methyl-5-hydroxy-6-metoxy-1,4-benzoquinol methylase
MIPAALENADIETSSEDYAGRFAGPVGAWFLDLQARATVELLRDFPAGSSLLDVGGGHAQLVPALLEGGYRVTVAGSDPACATRLRPWLDAGRCSFEVADLRALPYPQRSFDAVLCFRLLPHSVDWRHLVGQLCRVAERSVVVDYPSSRSVNIIADRLFSLKRRIERNTRPYTVFRPADIREAFAQNGFRTARERPQFVLPMVLHRALGAVPVSRSLERVTASLGMRRWLGSPIIARADRVQVAR